MAGETAKTTAICLAIHPWSRTSHIVRWLTPNGIVTTLVKGAVRPKSAFLGQYDLNYTCEIVYYLRGRGELHALRECSPLQLRERLRTDHRSLVLADYFRSIAADHTPNGRDAGDWYDLVERALDGLTDAESRLNPVARMISFELAALKLAGLSPELEEENGVFHLRGERAIKVEAATVRCIRSPEDTSDQQILLDAARVIGVFYVFHMDASSDIRRSVLRMISKQLKEKNEDG